MAQQDILMKMNMNLNAYDNIIEQLDKTKTWIDTKTKQLFSREIKYRRYNCLLKRYNIETNTNSYYIAVLDNPPENKKYKHTQQDDYGRIKISLASIWKETYLARLTKDCNISCNLVDSDNDGEVYLLDI